MFHQNLKVDFFDIPVNTWIPTNVDLVERIHPITDGFPQLVFKAKDVEILTVNDSLLNDICVNRCVALLYSKFCSAVSDRIAIFSMHDLSCVWYNATDDIIWRNIKHTQYWDKLIWILPIHHPGHWVMCTIDINEWHLLLFDSLMEHCLWKKDVEVRRLLLS